MSQGAGRTRDDGPGELEDQEDDPRGLDDREDVSVDQEDEGGRAWGTRVRKRSIWLPEPTEK